MCTNTFDALVVRLEVLERARTRIAKEVSRGGHLAVGLGAAADEG